MYVAVGKKSLKTRFMYVCCSGEEVFSNKVYVCMLQWGRCL